MRISDWSSDVCSSDLRRRQQRGAAEAGHEVVQEIKEKEGGDEEVKPLGHDLQARFRRIDIGHEHQRGIDKGMGARARAGSRSGRSEEHTSELQSLMRISYAVFCLKKKKNKRTMYKHADSKTSHK